MWHMKMNYRMYNLMLTVYLNGDGKTGKIDQCIMDLLHYNAQSVLCKVYFSAQPNKLRTILKFEHIFVPA